LLKTAKDHETKEYSFNLKKTLDSRSIYSYHASGLNRQKDKDAKELALAVFIQLLDKTYALPIRGQEAGSHLVSYLSSQKDIIERIENISPYVVFLKENLVRVERLSPTLIFTSGSVEPALLSIAKAMNEKDYAGPVIVTRDLINILRERGFRISDIAELATGVEITDHYFTGKEKGILAGLSTKGTVDDVIEFIKTFNRKGIAADALHDDYGDRYDILKDYLKLPNYADYDPNIFFHVEEALPHINEFVNYYKQNKVPENLIRLSLFTPDYGNYDQRFFPNLKSVMAEINSFYQTLKEQNVPLGTIYYLLRMPDYNDFSPQAFVSLRALAETLAAANNPKLIENLPYLNTKRSISPDGIDYLNNFIRQYWVDSAGRGEWQRMEQTAAKALARGDYTASLVVPWETRNLLNIMTLQNNASAFPIASRNGLWLFATANHVIEGKARMHLYFYDTPGAPAHDKLKRIDGYAETILWPAKAKFGESRVYPWDFTVLALRQPDLKLKTVNLGLYEDGLGVKISPLHRYDATSPFIADGGVAVGLALKTQSGDSGAFILNSKGKAMAILVAAHGYDDAQSQGIAAPFNEMFYRQIQLALGGELSAFRADTSARTQEERTLLRETVLEVLKDKNKN